ncbi:hypothetical protein FET70_03113 (plasmid) [Lactiplantibacillus plantarum]|nr:hypothetical protein FET70_03113 [Lactiplantibacillus plantarum]
MAESSEEEQQLMQAMGLITNAGNAKSLAMKQFMLHMTMILQKLKLKLMKLTKH